MKFARPIPIIVGTAALLFTAAFVATAQQPVSPSTAPTVATPTTPAPAETTKDKTVIGPVETPVRPTPDANVMTAPTSTNSSGPRETGPHGQVTPTVPPPAKVPEAARTAPDRPVAAQK